MTSHNQTFMNNIQEITKKPYKQGIKLMNPNKFRSIYDDSIEHCLCGHAIKNIYTFTYNDVDYNIGSECVKRHPEFDVHGDLLKELKKNFKKEQRAIMKQAEDNFKTWLNNMNNINREYMNHEVFDTVHNEITIFNSKVPIKAKEGMLIKDLFKKNDKNTIIWLLDNFVGYQSKEKKKAFMNLIKRHAYYQKKK